MALCAPIDLNYSKLNYTAMKHFNLLKTLLLLCALIVGSLSGWATETTLVFNTSDGLSSLGITAPSKSNGTNLGNGTYSVGDVNLSSTDGSTATRVWNSGGTLTLRVYNGGSLTLSVASGSVITSIIFSGSANFTSMDGWNSSSKTWTGSSNSVTFSNSSSQSQIQSIKVTYSSSDSRTAVASIGGINPTSLAYGAEGSFSIDVTPADGLSASDYTVAWTEVNDAKLTLLEDGTYEAGTTKGDVEVEVTINPNNTTTYKSVSKTFTVNIYNPNAGDGSEARPFSVAEALENTPASGTSSSYFIKGNVSKFYNTSIMGDDTNYRYYISDDDGTTNELLVYRGKNIGNVAFKDASDLNIGDAVVVYGGLTTYSSTKEIAANNYIVSINGKKLPGIAYATDSYNTLPANTGFEAPVLTNPNNLAVIFSTDNADVADVNATTGVVTIGEKEGTATITATFAGNSLFLSGTATYTITTARGEANISFSETSVTITKGDEFTAPTFNNPNSLTGIVFTSSYNDVATVSDAGVITLGGSTGAAIIKAKYTGGVQYNEGETTCMITVNPAGVTPEPSAGGYYEKVSSDANLIDGEKYLIVNESASVALGAQNGSYRDAESVTFEQGNITEIGDATVITLVKSNDKWKLKLGDTKFYTTTTAKSMSEGDTGTDASIYFDANKDVIIDFGSAGKLYYNSGNPRFLNYTSSQTKIQLYKFVAGAAPSDIDIYVSAAGYSTYASNFDLDFTSVTDLKAYIAKEDNSAIKMVQINKVPKGTGILLRATDGGDNVYSVPTATTTDDVTGNLFVRGNDEAVVTGNGPYNYILNVVNNQLGFYKAAGNVVGKNRAYLHTTIAASSRINLNFDDETTGIAEVKTNAKSDIFNINGQRVEKTAKGLYIMNGKKFIVK